MLELTILLVAGAILAALFVLWGIELGAGEFEVAPVQLEDLFQLIPLPGISYAQFEQLFDARDYRYLERLRLHDVARQLERDRRQAALLWLRLLREDLDKLQQFRRLLVVCGARTSVRAEWALLTSFLSFRVWHGLLGLWIHLFGLYAPLRVHTALAGSAYRIFSQVACALARLSPTQLAEVKDRWAFRVSAP